jgi:hypothetical protein
LMSRLRQVYSFILFVCSRTSCTSCLNTSRTGTRTSRLHSTIATIPPRYRSLPQLGLPCRVRSIDPETDRDTADARYRVVQVPGCPNYTQRDGQSPRDQGRHDHIG